jgi:SAM-dependent methyltransferase
VGGVKSERAMSFGAIADEYNRLRPSPPRSAIDWLVPDGCRVAVDLAAGTGLLTRALLARVPEVIAVEPDDRMASVLREHTPGVRVMAGKGEAIPLETATADGLFISSAWHWLDPELAITEIARVLRDGGRFGAIWTSRDRQVDWVREMDQLRDPGRFRGPSDLRVADDAGALPGGRPSRREVRLPEGSPFGQAQTESFTFTRLMTADDFVEMLGTYSGIITASPEDRAAAMAQVRAAVQERFPGAGQIDVPMRSLCWRADRVSR